MSLTASEEALVRQLLDQQAAILSLAGNEATITSKLGATKVTLADLVTASSVADVDLLLMRQGTNDKSLTAALLAQYCSEEFLAGITTPPQFDNDTSLATTAFVKRALGSFAVRIGVGANTTLSASAVGNMVNVFGAGVTITMPIASSVPGGSVIAFETAPNSLIISKQGSDVLYVGTGNTPTITLKAGETVLLESNGVNGWTLFAGSGQLSYSSSFASSISGSGYQMLPSGLIIQWGVVTNSNTPGAATAVTLPIAFPSYALIVQNTPTTSTGGAYAWVDGLSASSFNSRCSLAGVPSLWLAIGI